jgi:phosphatidate cytidylyltransferase
MFIKRVPTSVFLIFCAIWFVFLSPSPVFLIICMVFAFAAMREFYGMMDKRGFAPLLFYGSYAGLIILVVAFINARFPWIRIHGHFQDLTYFIIIFGVFLVAMSRNSNVRAISTISSTLFGIFYIAWMFSYVIKIRYLDVQDGPWHLLFLLLVTKATDVFAYCYGTAFGTRKLVPDISPAKTIEGAIAGFFGAVVMAITLKYIFPSELCMFDKFDVICLGLLLGFFAQVGDIFESIIKRDAGVKDSGSILPGMGGVLDLMDSVLITAPIMYFYVNSFIYYGKV